MGLFSSLPKPGSDFSFNSSYHSFEQRLRLIASRGELRDLEDNIENILKVIKEYEPYIRKGGLSSDQRQRVWEKIYHLSDEKINEEEKHEIKELLLYLGKK